MVAPEVVAAARVGPVEPEAALELARLAPDHLLDHRRSDPEPGHEGLVQDLDAVLTEGGGQACGYYGAGGSAEMPGSRPLSASPSFR